MNKIRLGVNIDHVATVRNARGEIYPSPLRAALLAEKCGAHSITIHLREDRRHINDLDLKEIRSKLKIPLNLEIAATKEMLKIALRHKPNFVCIVPEKREEITTEGGIDTVKNFKTLKNYTSQIRDNGSRVSLFIDADKVQIDNCKKIGADIIEIHTGKYCQLIETDSPSAGIELEKIVLMSEYAASIGLEIHAGHGITFNSIKPLAKIQSIKEFNIGHFIIGESIFMGLEKTIKKMKSLILES
jgi:pyridoxine 5-phosphate synthase